MPAPALASINVAIQKAEGLVRSGDWHAALTSYRTILQDLLSAGGVAGRPLGPAHLVAMDRFADIAATLGYTRAASEILSAMAAVSGTSGDSYGRDYALVKQLLLEVGAGELAEAKEILRALAPSVGPVEEIEFSESGLLRWETRLHWPRTEKADRDVLLSQLYLALGSLLAALGTYANAIRALRRGLAFTGPGTTDLAQRAAPLLHLAIASALLEKGELASAQNELGSFINQINRSNEPALFTRASEIQAKLHLVQGDFGQAQSELHEVVDLCAERQFDAAEGRARLNLAQMLIFLNKTNEAQKNIERALTISRARQDQAMFMRAKCLALTERARLTSVAEGISLSASIAPIWLNEPLSAQADADPLPLDLDLPQSPNFLAFFEDRLLAAHWQLGLGNLSSARQLLSEMQQTFQASDSQLIEMRLDAFEALLCYYERNYQQACSLLRGLLPALSQIGLKPELWQSQRVLGWSLARANAPQADLDDLRLLSQTLLDEMTATLPPDDQAIYNLNKWTSDEEYLAVEINALVAEQKQIESVPALFRPIRRLRIARRVLALSQRIDRFKEDIAKLKTDRSPVDRALSLRQLLAEQWALRANEATLQFLVLPDRLLLIQRTRYRVRFGVTPVSRIVLRGLVKEWHEWTVGLRTGGDFQTESAATAAKLDNVLQLTRAVATLPTRVKSLRIAPDDSLHGFPFAVLKYQGKFLIERLSISIHHSLHGIRIASPRKPSGALFAGVSHEAPGYPALTLANDEKPAFQQCWAQVPLTELVNQTASRNALLAALQSCSFAHVTCHGVFKANHPEATGLVLVPNPPNHEVLSVSDVAHLRLADLRHLTLSSCWSADNFVLPGRWVISFPQVFHMAGAETVLACLWEVDQAFAISFFARYYSYLAKFPPEKAMAETQRDCIQRKLPGSGNSSWDDPIYWAGYRIYGGTRMTS